jgi:hypothetical protein
VSHDPDIADELLRRAASLRFRVLRVQGEEHPDASWQHVTCHLHRQDLAVGALAFIYAVSGLSFEDARPRGTSQIDFLEDDAWTVEDVVALLRYEGGALRFEADYVRGRMMKTAVTVHPNGRVVITTRNRHEMALRWLNTIRGRKHLRLA